MNSHRYYDTDQPKKSASPSKRKWKDESTHDILENKVKSEFLEDDDKHIKRTKFDNREWKTSGSRDKHHEKTDWKLKKIISYYEKILETLKNDFPKEDTDLFASTILEESKGYELKICHDKFCSHCIEILLPISNDPTICRRFLTSFSEDKIEAFTNASVSHITELLLNIALKNIQNWSSILESEEDSTEKEDTVYFISAITNFSEFIIDNFSLCLQNQFACHVVCTVIRVLGGDMSDATNFRSKASNNYKNNFRQQYVVENQSEGTQPIVLESVPKFFRKMLKKLAKALREMENISEYVTDSSCGTVIQTLLCVTKKCVPKHCNKLIRKLALKIFSEKNTDGIPHAFVHRNCSYTVEKMFETADEELQLSLWNEYFADCFDHLVSHPIGNHIIQRLFVKVESKSLLELMVEKIGSCFESILSSRNYGVFLSIAEACNRLKTQQSQFMKNIMNCLHCGDTAEKEIYLAPLVMSLQTLDQHKAHVCQQESCPKAHVCLHGSLLAQAMLKFQKPNKMVHSMLNMKTHEIADLACHIQGCHVLNAFFSSSTVGEKSKESMIRCLEPAMVKLACDRNGSLTLSRIWMLLSLKHRTKMAEILAKNDEAIKNDRNGRTLMQKFSIFYFKKNYEDWKKIQINVLKKNTMKQK